MTRISRKEAILSKAETEAARLGSENIEPVHLLLALLGQQGSDSWQILHEFKFSLPVALKHLYDHKQNFSAATDLQLSTATEAVLTVASAAEKQYYPQTEDLHILYALLACLPLDPALGKVFDLFGADFALMLKRVDIALKLSGPVKPPSKFESYKPNPQVLENFLRTESGSAPDLERTASPKMIAPRDMTAVSDWFSEDAFAYIEASRKLAQADERDTIALIDLFRAFNTIECGPHPVKGLLAESLDYPVLIELLKDLPVAAAHDAPLFTEHCLNGVVLSHNEARQMDSLIEPHHLFLGALRAARVAVGVADLGTAMKAESLESLRSRLIDSLEVKDRTAGRGATVAAKEPAVTSIHTTERLIRSLHYAIAWARTMKHVEVNPGHLILGMLDEAAVTEVTFVSENRSIFKEIGMQIAIAFVKEQSRTAPGRHRFSEEAKQALAGSLAHTGEMRCRLVDMHHLFLSIIDQSPAVVEPLLTNKHVTPKALRRRLASCQLWQKHNTDFQKEAGEELDINIIDRRFENQLRGLSQIIANSLIAPSIWDSLDDRSRMAVASASQHACRCDHHEVDIAHLMLGLLSERDGIAYKALSYAGLTNKEASERVKIYQTRGSRRTGGPRQLSKAVLSILKQAGRSAEPETPALTPEMMLRAIIAEGHGLAQLAFEILDIDPDTLEKDLALCISGQPGYS